MEISVASQLWAIVYSLAVGVFLGLSYDAVRITRVLAGLRPCTPTRLSSVNLPIIGRRAGEIKKRNRFFADVFVFGTVSFVLSAVFAYFAFFLLFPFRMIYSRIVLPLFGKAKRRRNSMRTDRIQKGLVRELEFF